MENLQNLLQSGVKGEAQPLHMEEGGGSGVLPRRADTFGGYDSSPTILSKSESSTLSTLRKFNIFSWPFMPFNNYGYLIDLVYC